MKTKTMKTIQLWMLALVLMISSSTALTSCSKDDTLVPPSPAQPVILTGEAAVAWTKDHLDSLVNVYLASCGNLLDPDMTRDLLSCIGYTRLNVFDYREAGWLIDSVVLVRLMDRAAERNNKTILLRQDNQYQQQSRPEEVGGRGWCGIRRSLQQREILRRCGGGYG